MNLKSNIKHYHNNKLVTLNSIYPLSGVTEVKAHTQSRSPSCCTFTFLSYLWARKRLKSACLWAVGWNQSTQRESVQHVRSTLKPSSFTIVKELQAQSSVGVEPPHFSMTGQHTFHQISLCYIVMSLSFKMKLIVSDWSECWWLSSVLGVNVNVISK